MIYFIETLHIFMYIELAYEFCTYRNKIHQWTFEYLRDIEIKKVMLKNIDKVEQAEMEHTLNE
jgi:hypothetical protein